MLNQLYKGYIHDKLRKRQVFNNSSVWVYWFGNV